MPIFYQENVNFRKIDIKAVFLRDWTFFFYKYRLESSVFFREWTFSCQNRGMREVISLTNRKKGYPIDFFDP